MSIVRVQYPEVDAHGDRPGTEPTRTTLEGAFTAPRGSSDVIERGRDGVVISLDLFTPYGTEIGPADAIEVDGDEYQIVGGIHAWKHPFTGWEAGQTCALERGQG